MPYQAPFVIQERLHLKLSLARLIQNGFTGEAKVDETRKTSFSRLLVHFNPGLQNGFTLQCLDLRKIDEAETDISRAKEAWVFGKGRHNKVHHVTSLA